MIANKNRPGHSLAVSPTRSVHIKESRLARICFLLLFIYCPQSAAAPLANQLPPPWPIGCLPPGQIVTPPLFVVTCHPDHVTPPGTRSGPYLPRRNRRGRDPQVLQGIQLPVPLDLHGTSPGCLCRQVELHPSPHVPIGLRRLVGQAVGLGSARLASHVIRLEGLGEGSGPGAFCSLENNPRQWPCHVELGSFGSFPNEYSRIQPFP